MRGAFRSVVAFCLGTSALTLPAVAASFSVGGGTITTSQADNSVDNTGTGGAFALQANTVSSGDAITISNVNTTALDVGNLLPSTGSYSVTMQGSTLSSGGAFFRSINGGPISFDSTGGAANTLSGPVALNVGVNSGSGGVSIKTGADIINGAGCCVGGIAISAVGSGTVSVDTIGATITSAGLYGIVAQSGNGNVIIGGLNGGMASNVTANNGYGIYATSSANVSVTIAPSGSITALNGIYTGGIAQIDNFGTLAATNNAIDASSFGQLTATLETGSTTSGKLLGGSGGDIFNIVAGANITNATFDGGAGTNTLSLTGAGTASLNLSNVSNIQNLQKNQTGTWTLSGTGSLDSVVVNTGILKAGSSTALSSTTYFTMNGGTFDLNGNDVSVGTMSGTGGIIALGANTLTATSTVYITTLSSVITGTGSVTKAGPGTLTLSGNSTYSGGTTIINGFLGLGLSTAAGTGPITMVGGGFDELDYANGINVANNLVIGNSAAQLGVANNGTAIQSGVISEINGSQTLVINGPGTLVLTGNNTFTGGINIKFGAVQVSADQNLGDPNGAIRLGTYSGLIFGSAFNLSPSRAIIINTAPGGYGLINTNGFDTTLTQGISGNGDFVKIGTGTLTMNGVSSYSGGTNLNQGVLRLGIDNALPSSLLIVNGGGMGTLDLNNHNQTIGALGGGGNITLGSGTLTVNGGAFTWDGAISGSGSLVKTSSGTLTLTGANTFTGGTTVSGGTLQLGNGGSLSNTGALTINGGTFDLNGHSQTVGPLSGSGGTIAGNQGFLTTNSNINTTLAASIVGADQLTKAGIGTLTLTGNSDFFSNPGILISAGAVQIGNGGTSGSVTGNITDNAALVFNRSDAFTYAGRIDGNGTVQMVGTGTLILTGYSNQFTGTTVVSAGTLQIGNGGAGPALQGNIVDNSVLVFDVFGPYSQGAISGSGSVQQIGTNTTTTLVGANTYTGGTIVNGGTLQLGAGGSLAPTGPLTVNGGTFSLNGQNQTVGALSGNGGFIALTNATLTTNAAADTVLASQFTSIFNAGSLIKTGNGKLTLTGDSFVGSGITILAGALQIGNGGTAGSLQGRIANSGTLIFNRSDASFFGDIISGSGSVIKAGGNTLTLFAANTYTGPTTVSAGALSVNGSIASSAVTVASGATLNGTGTVGATTIQNGGTLAPGNSIGTLSVNGNLTLVPGSIYNVEISPTAADRTNVSGAASLNGSVAASVASGAYSFGQRFTLINATGGVSGSFASLTGIPVSLKGQLSYDANNAYLTLSPNTLAPLLSNATGNQQKLVAVIDAAVAAGNVPPTGFVALYGLSGSALNSALDQISGQAAPNVVNAVGNSFLSFMSMTAAGGGGSTGSFAPGSAYGKADAPHRAQLGSGEMRVWGAAYGGHVGLSGDAASGAAGLSSNNVGMIGGADMKVADGVLAGVTLGMGRQTFHSGNGSGNSDDFMFGLYGRAEADAAYVTASLGFGWHQIKTLRVLTVSGTDVLQGKQNADDFGGRIEAGWHLPLDDSYTVAPYAAFAGESFESPAYAETAISGASTFALSYATHTSTLGRSELGARLDHNYTLEQGSLAAGIRAAWAHQLDDQPFTQASFINLPGAAFQVAGVRPASDTALLGLDLEVQNSSGLFFGIHGEGQFGTGTTVVEGLGNFGWRW